MPHEKAVELLVRQNAGSLGEVSGCPENLPEIMAAETGRAAGRGREILPGRRGKQMVDVGQYLHQSHCHSSYLTRQTCSKQLVEGIAA